jgi:hypothetical protein
MNAGRVRAIPERSTAYPPVGFFALAGRDPGKGSTKQNPRGARLQGFGKWSRRGAVPAKLKSRLR